MVDKGNDYKPKNSIFNPQISLLNFKNSFSQTPSFVKWIKCTQKYAAEGLESQKSVEISCHDDRVFHPPKCDHEDLFHFNRKPEDCVENDLFNNPN